MRDFGEFRRKLAITIPTTSVLFIPPARCSSLSLSLLRELHLPRDILLHVGRCVTRSPRASHG